MGRGIVIGLLALLLAGSSTPIFFRLPVDRAIAMAPAAKVSISSGRDVFYMSDRFGFRTLYPSGYTLQTPEPFSSKLDKTALEVLQFWQQGDLLTRDNQPEPPPVISLTIYENSPRLPLRSWKVDLSNNDDRPLTVGGQKAIAYTSTGLYESDNVLFSSPDGRYIFNLQGNYLDRNSPIRQTFQAVVSSFTFDVLASSTSPSKRRINYSRLQNLLAARNWQAADVETRAIIQRLTRFTQGKGDYLYGSKSLFNLIPSQDLRTIDSLWSKASHGQFGYTAQKKVWQLLSVSQPNMRRRVERFGQMVGWHRSKPLPENHPFRSELGSIEWRLDTELNYTANAPLGHFPWAGVSSSLLSDFFNERSLGCGSCTVDALYLASDRYYDYIPALFAKLGN